MQCLELLNCMCHAKLLKDRLFVEIISGRSVADEILVIIVEF